MGSWPKFFSTSVNQRAQQALGSGGHKKKRAREKETRERRGSSLTPRVSPSRAPVLSFTHHFQAPCYAGYQRICIFPTYEKFVSILKEACNRSNFGWLIRQMSMNQKRGRRFVEGLCWALFSFRLSHRNVIYRAKRKQSLISGESVRLTIGLPVVRMDGRAVGRSGGRAVGRCTVT